MQDRIDAALARVAPLQQPLACLPLRIGPWRGVETPLDERARQAAHFDDEFVNRTYMRPDGSAVNVFVGYTGRARARLGHRPDTCYAAHGWERVHEATLTVLGPSGEVAPARVYEFHRSPDDGTVLRVLATYVINGRYVRDPAEFTDYNARGARLLGERPAYLARVQATLLGTPDCEADLAVLKTFVAALAEPLAALLPYWAH